MPTLIATVMIREVGTRATYTMSAPSRTDIDEDSPAGEATRRTVRAHLAHMTEEYASIGVQLARTIPSGDGNELANWEALRKLGPKRFNRLLPLRRKGQVATIPASAGKFPSTPGRTRKDERAGYKRSQRFLKGLKAPAATSTASGKRMA